MKILLTMQILGLSGITLMEALHPGFVSGAVSLGWIWLISLGLMVVAISRLKAE